MRTGSVGLDPEDAFRWSVRVAATGKNSATVFARKQQFTVGAPVHFDEAYEHVSGLEYVLGAAGAELVNGLVARARQQHLAIDHAEAVVHGEINDALVYLGVIGATGHAGLEKVSIKVYVSSLEDENAIRLLWEEVLEKSPLVRALRLAIRLDLSLKVSL